MGGRVVESPAPLRRADPVRERSATRHEDGATTARREGVEP